MRIMISIRKHVRKDFNSIFPKPENFNRSLLIKLKNPNLTTLLLYMRALDLKDETIIYSAHWDHFGIGKPVDGDSIYNGAVDNATGVAAIMQVAEGFH